MKKLYCSACFCEHALDDQWRALTIEPAGDLRITSIEAGGHPDSQRPNTAFACGEGTVLVLVERYLQTGAFSHPPRLSVSISVDVRPITEAIAAALEHLDPVNHHLN